MGKCCMDPLKAMPTSPYFAMSSLAIFLQAVASSQEDVVFLA